MRDSTSIRSFTVIVPTVDAVSNKLPVIYRHPMRAMLYLGRPLKIVVKGCGLFIFAIARLHETAVLI